MAIAAAICVSPALSQGTVALKSISYVPDITVSLGGVTVPGGALAQEDLSTGAVSLVTNVPSLPDGAHIVAYQPASGGGALYAFDTTVAFGSLTVPRGDVVELGREGSSLAARARMTGRCSGPAPAMTAMTATTAAAL